MPGTSNGAHALNGFHERPSLSDTLHSHFGHSHLRAWLTGGPINAFFKSLKGLALNIYFLKNGQSSKALHEKMIKHSQTYTQRQQKVGWTRPLAAREKNSFQWKAGWAVVLTENTSSRQHHPCTF